MMSATQSAGSTTAGHTAPGSPMGGEDEELEGGPKDQTLPPPALLAEVALTSERAQVELRDALRCRDEALTELQEFKRGEKQRCEALREKLEAVLREAKRPGTAASSPVASRASRPQSPVSPASLGQMFGDFGVNGVNHRETSQLQEEDAGNAVNAVVSTSLSKALQRGINELAWELKKLSCRWVVGGKERDIRRVGQKSP